jgi:hypothetical protein
VLCHWRADADLQRSRERRNASCADRRSGHVPTGVRDPVDYEVEVPPCRIPSYAAAPVLQRSSRERRNASCADRRSGHVPAGVERGRESRRAGVRDPVVPEVEVPQRPVPSCIAAALQRSRERCGTGGP